ncbi:hypothetical protein E4K72_03555 [Oxalobacteraceae bacterium OM1]|nr:hypothetical protein E4K72_03555 [Oxalobacteraceae bacterium OM1]
MFVSHRASRQPALQRQRGFSLFAAFILVAALMAVLAYFLAGSGINPGGASSISGSARASSIITQASNIKTGVDLMTTNGAVTMSTLKFDNSANVGLFNVDTGGTSPQVPDISAYEKKTGPDGFWIYRGAGIKITGVGSGGASYAIVTTGLTQSVCEQINQTLHGSTTIPDSNKAAATFRDATATTRTSPVDTATTPTDLTSVSGIDGWDMGCLKTSDPSYVFYHVLKPQ